MSPPDWWLEALRAHLRAMRSEPLLPVRTHDAIPRHGLWLEFGVAAGTTLRRLAADRGAATLYGFDSFEGLPEDWRPAEGYYRGRFACDPPSVDGAHLQIGLFQDTLPRWLQMHDPADVTFVHIDCDIYSSAKCALDAIAPHMRPGACIEFDELTGYYGCEEHEVRALYELEVEHGFRYSLVAHQLGGQVLIRVE